MPTTTLDLTADIIDTRDIIARIEELAEDLREGTPEIAEFEYLQSILMELRGAGGDEQYRGHWYPLTLINESYFVEYVQELLEDCGDIPKNLPHYVHIDWQATARDIRVDYSCIDINGMTYWFR